MYCKIDGIFKYFSYFQNLWNCYLLVALSEAKIDFASLDSLVRTIAFYWLEIRKFNNLRDYNTDSLYGTGFLSICKGYVPDKFSITQTDKLGLTS